MVMPQMRCYRIVDCGRDLNLRRPSKQPWHQSRRWQGRRRFGRWLERRLRRGWNELDGVGGANVGGPWG